MDRGYNHDDKAKEFVGGFSLVKKDQVSVKKPIRTESEWIHIFGAWSTGVVLVYCHCADELEGYQQFVLDLFHAAPSQPQLAISFNVEVQDKYAKSPFHLDDWTELNIPFMVLSSQANSPHSGVGPKRAVPSLPQNVKQSMVICQNWNLGWSALYTETAAPLPSLPSHLLNDPSIQASLEAMEGYIKVDTPFDVNKLEVMLHDHPNQPFVHSVLHGLHEAVPYVCGVAEGESLHHYQPQRVWDKQWIPKAEAKVWYDDMHDFGQALREAQKAFPGHSFVTFKSDVASAFLNLPAHLLWQLHQVVMVDGRLHIVQHLVFGNWALPRIWCTVLGLLCWLAVRKLDLTCLFVYMDDFFGWDFTDNLVFFQGKLHPCHQVQLLLFWEAIWCPFEDKKQEHGEVLKIIGFWDDANNRSLSLSPSSVDDILDKIKSFLATPGHKPLLQDWQRLGGHINWLLNVLPWGRPAITELYQKTSGKCHPSSGIPINAQVISDLSWLASVIPKVIGIHFVDHGMWPDSEADMVIWMDASLKLGLAFIFSNQAFVYPLATCLPEVKIDIFFLEMVAILSAIHHVASLSRPPHRLLIHTDSLDSVAVFNSLQASEALHNGPLLAATGVVLESGIDLHVRHIPSKLNICANMLSCLLFEDVMEGVLLSALSRPSVPQRVRQPMPLTNLDKHALHLQVSTIKKSMVQGYAMGMRDYIAFCIAHSLPLNPTPLNPLTSTIQGSKKVHTDGVQCKLPLRLSHLEAFLEVAASSKSYDDLLFITILSCCFYVCHRSGELIQKNSKSLFNWQKIIKCSSLTFPGHHAQYHLPYHKGDPFYRGTDILFTPQSVADPVTLLHQYVGLCDMLHGAYPALFLCRDGSHPSHSWFDAHFFAILGHEFGGHSPWASGVTFYANLGLPEDII
ncbi:hypothetical protein CPB84DRAFT_1858412 [Gymnopilus junonius]|uniref:Uncharacterized protein n=1 Tax=Gymnopilus junonius TaxID=109634 RepID=A0A9P5TEX4_GYMJU|nr:hypothetical protein CPB84DRAFT_1858412 [Gymnopilus junonius]